MVYIVYINLGTFTSLVFGILSLIIGIDYLKEKSRYNYLIIPLSFLLLTYLIIFVNIYGGLIFHTHLELILLLILIIISLGKLISKYEISNLFKRGMKNKIIIIAIVLLGFLPYAMGELISCIDDKYEENYPQTVSLTDWCGSIKSRYEIKTNNIEEFPEQVQDSARKYLFGKIGKPFLDKTVFSYGYIFSNEPLDSRSEKNEHFAMIYGEGSKEDRELDSKTNYPIYCFAFEYSDLDKGIEKYDLIFSIDNNGKIIKHIAFPNIESESINFIPVDSIHKILSNRKITSKNLDLDLRFNRNDKSLYYYARTLISTGSIAGPSCFPQYQEHFRLNALTSEIMRINSDNVSEYFGN